MIASCKSSTCRSCGSGCTSSCSIWQLLLRRTRQFDQQRDDMRLWLWKIINGAIRRDNYREVRVQQWLSSKALSRSGTRYPNVVLKLPEQNSTFLPPPVVTYLVALVAQLPVMNLAVILNSPESSVGCQMTVFLHPAANRRVAHQGDRSTIRQHKPTASVGLFSNFIMIRLKKMLQKVTHKHTTNVPV